MQITPAHNKAANDVIELIAAEIGQNRIVHPGTAIASSARLAGSFLFRSFNFQITDPKPGQVMLSNDANEKGPMLINITGAVMNNMGLQIDNAKMDTAPKAESNLNFQDALAKLQDKAVAIMKVNALDYEGMAFACAMATGFIIKQCERDVQVESAFHTAIYSYIEGTKTYPPELMNH